MDDVLRIDIVQTDSTSIVAAAGEIDLSTAEQLRHAIYAVIRPSTTAVIDLTAVMFIDSRGVQTLIGAHQEAGRCGCAMTVVEKPHSTVARVFDIMGVRDTLCG